MRQHGNISTLPVARSCSFGCCVRLYCSFVRSCVLSFACSFVCLFLSDLFSLFIFCDVLVQAVCGGTGR